MSLRNLIVEHEEGIGFIRLNRPEHLNALNTELLGELANVVSEMDKASETRVIVIYGTGKAFAAGADIAEMAEKSFSDLQRDGLFEKPLAEIEACRKPIIAAVSGYALGGGCELAMICDLIIAAEDAKFGQPEINLGVIPGMGGSQRLARAIGKSKAMDMQLTGRFMDAKEAERAGLVSRIVPSETLLEEVKTIARKIADKPQLAASATKAAVNRSFETTLAEGIVFERALFYSLFATMDQKEGMAAFLEKRDARFRKQ